MDSAPQHLDKILGGRMPEAFTAADWAALGFQNIDRIRPEFLALFKRFEGTDAVLGALILRSIVRSCDPDQSFFQLQRWLEGGGEIDSAEGSEILLLDLLCTLFAATPALSNYLILHPARTRPVLLPVLERKISGGRAWRERIDLALAQAETYDDTLRILRHQRVECMLQIAALDLLGWSKLQDTTRALSDLADALIEVALLAAIERVRPRLGALPPRETVEDRTEVRGRYSTRVLRLPPATVPFTVFALGKLGGGELNYSSDIDLVFMCENAGETSGGNRSVDTFTYCAALAEEITQALDKHTVDGRAYRVDLRLRPHGSAGPTVRPFKNMLSYFQTEGRTWERQAWLKARPVAGDIAAGYRLLTELESFVYRRYLSLDAITDIQSLKKQIEQTVARRGETEDEVKLGRGGIRDVEFTVQFMQLLHGAEHPDVRGGNTMRALYDLKKEGLMNERDVQPLTNAYVFHRHVEHRLQLHGDLQVHLLPHDPAIRRRIARSLGYKDSAEGTAQSLFDAERAQHTSRTRNVFEKLFANLFREHAGPEGELSDQLLAPEPSLEKLAAILKAFGFASPESSARELVELGKERLLLAPPSRTRKFFASVAPALLKALAATGEPDAALGRFSSICGSLGAKSMFFQMLNENEWMLEMTVNLAAWSEFLTSTLVANPGLFDALVDSLQTGQSKSVAAMTAELQSIANAGDISDTLRAYRAGELLRIGVRDLIHEASLEQTQHELSDLAEAILNIQLAAVQREFAAQRGEVLNEHGKPVGFAVLGLGKFGGREMNYGSDLDVIYFFDGEGKTAKGESATAYFAEFAQTLMRAMKTATRLGSLYELDARLRPMGSKGPLALSLDYFRRYWKEGQLADWERLALTRVRLVAGDAAAGERAIHLVRTAVYSPLKDAHELARKVCEMRARLDESADTDDLKRGKGGLMDVEFIAQYLQLLHGPEYPPLRQASTEQALRGLMKFRKLSEDDGKALLTAHEFLRRMENRVRVVHGLSAHKLPQSKDALRKLALRAGYDDHDALPAEEKLAANYLTHSTTVRAIFERLVGPVKL
jgi:[glutamine synthetase] adenylyltransferase / [glutamine synthetase]-adenylyl-L-tyrosine phosphorylase